MSEFTPGPWEADIQLGCVVSTCETRAPKGRRVVVADTEYKFAYRILSEEERAANTRLIAAAPELYEALQRIVGMHANFSDAPEWVAARAALSKASPQNTQPSRNIESKDV